MWLHMLIFKSKCGSFINLHLQNFIFICFYFLALNNLTEWTKPEIPPQVPIVNKMDTCFTVSEPLGVALIIGAWNYPIQLTIMPLTGAIAAGKLKTWLFIHSLSSTYYSFMHSLFIWNDLFLWRLCKETNIHTKRDKNTMAEKFMDAHFNDYCYIISNTTQVNWCAFHMLWLVNSARWLAI